MEAYKKKRTEKEKAALERLCHANVVRLLGEEGDDLLLEWLGDLAYREEDIVRLAMDVALGLAHCHSRGVIHMDIKPENIRMREDGTAVVCDFDLSILEGEPIVASGSPMFMAPELMDDGRQGERSSKVDVFSFGVFLRALYSRGMVYAKGERWRRPRTLLQLVEAVTSGYRLTMDNVPESLREVVLVCCDDDPAKRPAMAEVVEWLGGLEAAEKKSTQVVK